MAVLGNRRSRVDASRAAQGNRVPGAIESPLALRSSANARTVAQASLESTVISDGDVGVLVQEASARLDQLASGELASNVQLASASAAVAAGTGTVLADAFGGAITITLPPAAANNGRQITVKKVDASGNAVTIDGNAAETIDGAVSYALPLQNDFATVVSDGTNWQLIGAS